MSPRPRTSQKKQLPQWAWNIPLLVRSLSVLAGVVLVATLVYFWQSSSMASELLEQAKSSDERGENREKVKWLTRYVRLVPNDVKNLAELAFAVDTQETGSSPKVEYARSRLAAALVACGEAPEHEELRKQLRRKLVPRLLQFGSSKATEAEEQIMLLQAPEGDAEVTKWLAQSLVMQRAVSEFQDRDADNIDKQKDYWKWVAAQPVGQVLQMAVQCNPVDVETASLFLSVINQRPGWFGTTTVESKVETESIARQTLERLIAMKADGRAQLVAYVNTAITDKDRANAILREALEPAFNRLTEIVNRSSAGKTASEELNPKISPSYSASWDWQIATENAKLAGGAEAESICQRLIGLVNTNVGARQIEEAYMRLAMLKLERKEYGEVLDVCRSGLETLKQSSALNRLVASSSIQLRKFNEARAAVSEIESDTESRLRQLDGASGLTMSTDEKQAVRQQILTEQWTANLLKGQLALADEDWESARKMLQDAYKTNLPIMTESRVDAGKLLAECYIQLDQWDSAAQVLSDCAALMPSDKMLVFSAARAWRRVGSTERAIELMEVTDDDSYITAMEKAVLIASKPANQVDRRALAAAIKKARVAFDATSADQKASLEPWKLELFEIRISVDENPKSEQVQAGLGKLELLAEKYPDVSEVQSLVALDFAAFGQTESLDKSLSRLEKIAESSQKAVDRASLELVKARVCLVRNNKVGALDILKNAMKAIPDESLAFAKFAARLEIRENHFDQAYELLSSVPDERLDLEAIQLLTGLGDNLRFSNQENATKLSSKLDRWIERFKDSEGPEGTVWRYLIAERLLSRFVSEPNNRQILDAASDYFKEIDARRQHWGVASALGGKIASLRAALDRQKIDSEEAIALWRRAIRDGDDRVSTVMNLVRELNLVNRTDEANTEFQRISSLSDSILPISRMAISSAVQRGDFSEALAIADRLTSQNPDDVAGWILKSQATLAASAGLQIDENAKTQLRDKAWSYLEKAFGLSRALNVWDARFGFKVGIGDQQGASAVLEDFLQEPSIPQAIRFQEAGRGYLSLREFGLARKYLDNSLLVNPNSSTVHLLIAELHSAIGDKEESLNSLRNAYMVDPNNQAIRDRLAYELALSKSGSFDWKEIDSLFSATALETPKSKILAALVALSRGDSERKLAAVKTLELLSASKGIEGKDAKRGLANYHASQWSIAAKENQTKKASMSFESARRLYEELLAESTINPNDPAAYANLLLLAFNAKMKESISDSSDDYLAMAESAVVQLENNTGSSVASLQLRVRLAIARKEEEKIEAVVEKWIEDGGDIESLGKENLWELAGQTLVQLGRVKQALVWFERLYAKDPRRYRLYALALAREKKFDQAFELCLTAFKTEATPLAATVIAEVGALQTEFNLPQTTQDVLSQSLAKFPQAVRMLESIGTMYLKQDQIVQAVGMFELSRKVDPNDVVTLNNLAMALSKMPMRQKEAIGVIENAIKLYGNEPDLLDTLGQVQLANGQIQEAVVTLTGVCKERESGTFRLHLAQALLAQNETEAAREQWSKVNQQELKMAELTTDEKKLLDTLESQFGGK